MPEAPGLGAAILVALLILAVVDAPLLLIARAVAKEDIGINHAVGIRIPSVMRSPEAWRAGHDAALAPITVGVIVSAVAALVTIALSATFLPYVIVLGVAIVAALTGLIVGTVRARQAAMHVNGAN